MRARSVHAFQHEDSQERRGARSLSFGLEPKLFRVALCHYFATTGRCIIQLSNGATYGPFTVANGPQGPQGNPGDTGAQGPQGEQGAPGEVTSTDLGTAIGGLPASGWHQREHQRRQPARPDRQRSADPIRIAGRREQAG